MSDFYDAYATLLARNLASSAFGFIIGVWLTSLLLKARRASKFFLFVAFLPAWVLAPLLTTPLGSGATAGSMMFCLLTGIVSYIAIAKPTPQPVL